MILNKQLIMLQEENTKYLITVSCTCLLCLLVLITATLDNVSWWSNSFPDAFMTSHSLKDLLNRLVLVEYLYFEGKRNADNVLHNIRKSFK